MTDIAWTGRTENPVTGCDRASPGCDHCYALTMARRLKAMGQPKYQRDGDPRTSGPGFGVTMHQDVLHRMLGRRTPGMTFVNSMSDLFHPQVTDDFITRTWAVMALTGHVTYQVLTKRAARLQALSSGDGLEDAVRDMCTEYIGTGADAIERINRIPWPLPNVWPGVSAENQKWADIRVPALPHVPAAVRWVSAEPLLGRLDLTPWLDPAGPVLGWVVAGCESGPGARPMDIEWVEQIVHDCQQAGVPVFVKQLPAGPRGRATQDITTFPAALRVRQYPVEARHGQ